MIMHMQHSHRGIRAVWAARAEPENLPILARWYWRTVLVLIACGIVAVAWSGWSLFSDVYASLESQATGLSRRTSAIDRSRLGALDAAFIARKAAFDAGTLSTPAPADPSL